MMHPRIRFLIKFILLVVFLLFFLNFFSVSDKLKNFLYLTSSPIQKFLWNKGIDFSKLFKDISNIKNLQKENKDLKYRNQELEIKNIKIFQLEEENKFLREAFGIGLAEEFNLIFAEVIGKDFYQDSILINKGVKDGVSKDLSVINEKNFLIGKIEEVYDNFSKVMLISNSKSVFDIEILSQEESIFGMAKGKGGFNLYLDLVSKEKIIKENDSIISSSLGGIFPKGLFVGKIKKIEDRDIDPFQRAEIEMAFNIKDLRSLFIIKK